MPTGRAVLVKMTVCLVDGSVSAGGRLGCLKCGGELELHQPDIEMPERFLATCGERCQDCGSWHLLEYREGPRGSLLVLLPSAEEIERASGAGAG